MSVLAMSKQENSDALSHDGVLELLPWYVNGTLESDERRRVAEHLELCGACSDELVRCQAFENAVQGQDTAAADDEMWMPSKQHFHSLLEQLDANDERQAVVNRAQPATPMEPRRVWWQDLLERIGAAADFPRWALAGQTAVIAMLAVALFVRAPAPEELGAEQILTRSSGIAAPLISHAVTAQLVFAPGVSEADVRTLLLNAEATIVDGPTKTGVYVIALPEKTEHVLEALKDNPAVMFAGWQAKGKVK